jgi:predicted ATP-grasp superfamily ATP-dependent carboligase
MALRVPDTSVPVVVLVLRPSAVQHRALPVARSAGRLGIAVYAVQPGPRGPDARSRYLRAVELLPEGVSVEECVDTLLRVARRLGRALLVPLDDAGTVLVDDHADVLAERFLFSRRPAGVGRLLASKRELHLLCKRLGVPSPRALFPEAAEEALEQAQELGFPIVAKRIDGWLPSADPQAPSVHIARDAGDLRDAFGRMQSAERANVMLQEFLPGTPRSVWMFNGYFDEQSEALVAFTGRKLRQHPPYSGVTSLGEATANVDVDRSMRRLLRGVDYRGIVDAGLRFDERDRTYKVLDVNPRIGATFRLFVGEEGLDVLRAMYLDLTGQQVPSTRQRLGRRWISEPLDLDSSFRYWRAGELGFRQWARSLTGVEEGAWLARDDPLPALAVTLPLASTLGRRLVRAARLGGRPATMTA